MLCTRTVLCSFNGGVPWRRQRCSGSMDGFLPTAVHNTVHYVHYNCVCRVQSMFRFRFRFIDHIWSLSYGVLILWIGWNRFLTTLYFVLHVHLSHAYSNTELGMMLCIYASGHSAIGEQCSPDIKNKIIIINNKYPRLCCLVDQHLQVATKPLPQLTLSIELLCPPPTLPDPA